MEGLASPVYSKNTIEFVTVANEFCKFIENAENLSLTNFVEATHRLLPLLYLKGTLLPEFEESYDEYHEKHLSEDDYNYIKELLLDKFGKYDVFDEIYDPLRQENDEPVQLSVAESFADIYQDLKDFILQFQVGAEEVMMNAIWECRQAFEQYWGQRLVNILRVLHNLKYSVVELETEGNDKTDGDKTNLNLDNVDTNNWLISKMQDDYNNDE